MEDEYQETSTGNRWPQMLEWAAIGLVAFSMFGAIAQHFNNGYNVALAFFMLHNAYSQTARINAICMGATLFSVIVDIVLMAAPHYGSYAWGFGLFCAIVVLLLKVGGMGIMFMLFNDLGGIYTVKSFPSAGEQYTQDEFVGGGAAPSPGISSNYQEDEFQSEP